MYQPAHFRETRLDVQHALIRRHPLGLLISAGPEGLLADPIPFRLDSAAAPLGVLSGHLARANGHGQHLRADAPVLVVFQGADTYVTPSWYQTKQETGKVVPTWNYAIVQVRGAARLIEDRDWLRHHVEALTGEHEAGRPSPWAVDDAPSAFLEAQLRGIVGIEIPIDTIEGKWKVSQNRPVADRAGVANGLAASDGSAAQTMAAMVREHLPPDPA